MKRYVIPTLGALFCVALLAVLWRTGNTTSEMLVEARRTSVSLSFLRQQNEALRAKIEKFDQLFEMQAEQRIEALLSQPKYRDPKRLNRYEVKLYAQAGEDGIIAEIFRRIGVTNKVFVEYGSGNGQENNTVWLLRNGWSGLWMEAEPRNVAEAKAYFTPEVESHKLTITQAFITPDNIETLLATGNTPPEFDLLSSDIDGNDYWVWSKIEHYRPRVVVIEYNAMFPPPVEWVQENNPKGWWDHTSHFGASLAAFETLARKKGYRLVGCNLGGVNSFWVREDLVGHLFAEPYTAANHFEPVRYFLQNRVDGYVRRP